MNSTMPEAQIMSRKCVEFFFLMFGIILLFEKGNYHFQQQFYSYKEVLKQDYSMKSPTLFKYVKISFMSF